jgi:type I restriction enzyme M protein
VYKPYARVSTAIIIFTKTGAGGTDKVWFYNMQADGYSLDDRRNEVSENDIPDIIARFSHLQGEIERKRTEQSFFVNKAELVANRYKLAINKYQEIRHEEIAYLEPSIVLQQILDLEKSIMRNLSELKTMIE